MKKNKYTEPVEYIPKAIRKELGIGEFDTSDEKEAEKERANKGFRDYVKKG